MYEFLDTNGHAVANVLPAEAVSINGTYLEDIVDGYRTLYVKGRESLGASLNTYTVGTADGERVKNGRYPARTLTVGFQLLCPTDEDFRQRFNQLNNILSMGEADFVFNDEPDKYFTGYPIMDADIEAGRNNVVGEWKIYCADPFKRSVNTVTLSSQDTTTVISGNTATFTFNYDGVMPSKPVLYCEFAGAQSGGDYNEDGDCGFVAFINQSGKIIQLGNPDVVDVDPLNKNGTLINSTFDALTGWTANGITVGTITDQYWNSGEGQTKSYAKGTGTLTRTTAGTVGFEFDIIQRLCVSSPEQTGSFQCALKNGNSTVVGYTIEKTGSGTNATVKYIINDAVAGTDTIDLSYYNTSFGYCNRTPVIVRRVADFYASHDRLLNDPFFNPFDVVREVRQGWNYTQSNLNSGISRDGGVVTFSVGNLPSRTFKRSAIENTVAYTVAFTTTGDFDTNAIGSCALISKKGVAFSEIPNVFTSGDIVVADCNSANVYLYRNGSVEGHLEPQYGALGNDWEDFSIGVGTNIIRAVWSDWTNQNYKPKIKIIYNRVYI